MSEAQAGPPKPWYAVFSRSYSTQPAAILHGEELAEQFLNEHFPRTGHMRLATLHDIAQVATGIHEHESYVQETTEGADPYDMHQEPKHGE